MHNILFIGGAGFIGSNIIKLLINKNVDNNIYVLEPYGANVNRLKNFNLSIFNGTLSDITLLNKIIDDNHIDIVVHLVSTLFPNSSYDDYKQEFENIVFPTIRLIKLCGEKGVKFIYFSSGGTIYGNRKTSVPFKEEDELAPISYYGLSKQIIENSILFEHRTNNVDYLILRPSNPYGKGQSLKGKQGLIAVSLGKILTNQPIEIYGNGEQIRDYIYIDDLCEIFYLLLKKNISNEIFNVSSGIGYSINEILKMLKDTVVEDFSINYVSSRSSDVSNMILDNSRLKNYISYNITPIEEGISEFYQYAKKLQ